MILLVIICNKINKGKESIEVAKSLNNIGNLYASIGNYKKAEKRLY